MAKDPIPSKEESDMIRMQIVERPGVKLFSVLKRAIRSHDLRTFSLERRGTRVLHVRSPGFMNWTSAEGIIACEIKSPRDEGKEWQLLSNVIGRLSDRFPDLVESINIQLTPRAVEPVKKKRKKRRG
jgi:hypothetical protein